MSVDVKTLDSVSSVTLVLTRRSGIYLMLSSALVFSTAGLFTKGVSADSWTIIFWRGLFATIFTTVYIQWKGALRAEFLCMGTPGWAVGLFGAAGTAAFIASFKLTSIANVSLIYATAPFVSACMAWLWFREQPTVAVMGGSLAALVGVLVIVGGSFGGVNLQGDLLVVWMTLMMSLLMVIYRRYPATPAAGPAVMSSVFLMPVALLFSDPFAAPLNEIAIMAAFGLVFAFASVALQEGARRLPPAEAALVSAMETPLAPLWAWMLFSEIPTVYTVTGGTIILLAVFGGQIAETRNRRNRPAS